MSTVKRKVIEERPQRDQVVVDLAFTPDGKYVVSVAQDAGQRVGLCAVIPVRTCFAAIRV
jgi:hypothetical protein